MYSPPGEERERAKQGLRHMASKRYIAVLHQYLIEERGTETELLSYLDEFVMLCGPTPETISVLRDLIWGASYKLKRSAIYQLGELWLSGQKPCSKLLETLPEIAAAINPELLYQLIHAIEKLARVHRLGEAQEAPREIISSLETIAKVPSSGPHDPNRARRLLNALQKQSTS
jgi:hypothetical protein